MKELKSNTDDKCVNTPIFNESTTNSNAPNKSDEKVDNKQSQWNWRKVVRTMRDVGSVASVIISLVKILEELGLLP